jgi:hypothetical protein
MVIYRRVPGTACRPIDGVMIVVHAREPLMATLNRTGGYIWSKLDGRVDPASLEKSIREAGGTVSENEIVGFLESLRERGFCEKLEAPAAEQEPPLPLAIDSPEPGESPALASVESIEAMMGVCNSTTWRDGSGCMTMPGFCSVLQS